MFGTHDDLIVSRGTGPSADPVFGPVGTLSVADGRPIVLA